MQRRKVDPVIRRHADDSGSLAFALMVTLVGMTLSALLVPMVVGQIRSTGEESKRVQAVNAAQAGMDVALEHIQAASDGSGNGVLASLPCGPFTGSVGAGGSSRYQVNVDYFPIDPKGHDQDTAWITANRINCISGGGTYSTPSYALLRALGTDQATGAFTAVPTRSLAATYKFEISNQNIPGGLIRTYKSAKDLCLDAGSSSPAAGTNVVVQPCVAGSSQQKWAYSSNLSLVLVTSRTPGNPAGMCIDGGATEKVGNNATMQPCVVPKTAQQQWSLDDASKFEGTSDGKNLNKLCLNPQVQDTAGSFIVLGKTDAGTCPTLWSPEASAGAGAAGPATGQLVNFAQFGRCLDITNKDVTYPHEIAWPCKQAPDPTTLTWNQVFSIPAVPAGSTSASGPISTVKSGITYCLESPNSTAPNTYVIVEDCSTGPAADEIWTVYGDTGSYNTSYRIADKNGYCLSPTDQYATPPDLFANGTLTSKIVVAVCSGSTLQKWNAPPNILQSSPLSNIKEK
jgi:hypothetical protein